MFKKGDWIRPVLLASGHVRRAPADQDSMPDGRHYQRATAAEVLHQAGLLCDTVTDLLKTAADMADVAKGLI